MRVFAARHIDVQIHAELIRNGGKEFMRQVGIEIADPARADFDVVGKIGPATQVNYDFRESLVQWTTRFAEAADAVFFAESIFECLP